MEKQFAERVKIIKEILGQSIDEIALTATVLHKEDSVRAVQSRYEENFDANEYRTTMETLFKGEKTDASESTDSKVLGTKSGVSAGKVDLLNAAAIIMADSAGWTGTYNEDKYKEALAGDKLIGNNSETPVSDFVNGVFCSAGAVIDGVFSSNNITYQFASGQDVMAEINRTATRWNNMKNICENGYIGGVYNITPETQANEENRNLQKKAIANEIIDLVHYYKKLVDYEENENNCISEVNGSLDGNTQAADLVGKTREQRIEIIGPIAQAVYAKTGIWASATIAQLIKESGIGEAYDNTSFIKQNNLGGVKCRTGRACENGYAVFENLEDAIMDRAKMFDNGMYPNWRSNNSTPMDFLSYVVPIYCPADDGCDPGGYVSDCSSFISDYNLKKYDVKTKNTTTNNSVGNWKQYEGSWKDIQVGNGGPMSEIGCLVTSAAIQMARSGTRISNLPSGYNSFDPGALVTALNNNNGFAGAALSWNKLNVVANNWKYVGQKSVTISDNATLAKTISEELKTAAEGKYQKFLILYISHDGSSEHWVAVNGVENNTVKIFDPGARGTTLDENYTGWTVHGYAIMYATDVEFGKIGMSTDAGGDQCNVNLNYDYEAMTKLSASVSMSHSNASEDLAGTKYGTVEAFNQHIKDCVEQAGYGTRAGVVAAGVCLAYDYMEATGKRYRYVLSASEKVIGIKPDSGLACSTYVWWAVLNGGFNLPETHGSRLTEAQARWALENGYNSYDYQNAQPGDFLVYSPFNGNMGHSRLIIGKNEAGLYIAEEDGGKGASINFSSFDKLSNHHYWVVNMSDFYGNPANIRR